MKKDKLLGEDLLTLQKQDGNICISIILPTHRLFSDRKVDKFEMEKAVENATQLLGYKYSLKDTKPLISKLQEMAKSIDYDHNLDGVGLYVSDQVSMMVKFPFAVKEKVIVDDNFEIRDILYKTSLSRPYYALMLSEKNVRLFEGCLDQLTEIRGKHFPYEFYDDYEYNTPSRGSSNVGNPQMRSFEHDKSTMEAIRFKDYFRNADEYLGDYMVENVPLIISGTDKDISWFESVTAFNKQIVGKIHGSYDNTNVSDYGKKCWTSFGSFLKSKVDVLIDQYKEKVGSGLAVSGIQEIWTAALEGRGLNLIVEKDYKVPGFTMPDHAYFMTLRPPKEKHNTMPDAVDEIIEAVLEKGGDVIFAENGQLAEFGHMVLITRY
jgi:Bacterial archaeo-eukaryotic release factor family 3